MRVCALLVMVGAAGAVLFSLWTAADAAIESAVAGRNAAIVAVAGAGR
jgi:hypothetical protein